ncbi:AmiS/UreI family transporter [Bacillus sp. PK9-021]|uniref:AmiS/UreI family transporter n=1 Tax=Priestia megaterium TaxID=1404 RepID=UPI000BF34E82|nr:AmiS/UreI family transporter [Priestia megaterium]PFJ95353.1 urease accessory protein UreI [Priestia megaterium]UKJ78582.1 urease accessory protein UreI [Priestia megaterium]
MDQIGLLLSGAALFLNGLMLLGKADEKNVGVFNLFVGAFQVIVPFYLIITSDQSNWILYERTAIFLFGLTYLYVGVTVLKGMQGTGLGYYSLWVSIIALVYVTVSLVHYHDVINAITWILWSFLWLLFYVLNTSKKDVSAYVGKVAIVQSWVTLTIPALFSLTGVWGNKDMYNMWGIVLVASIIYFVYLGYRLFFSQPQKMILK